MSVPETLETRLRSAMPELTRTERQLAAHILSNFPVSALGSVASVARAAQVSSPTVIRMVKKLGFDGFPQFQAQLHAELGERLASPLSKHDKWAGAEPNDHILNVFAEKMIENVNATLRHQDPVGFDAAADLLSDRERHIYMIGGRLTRSVADYMATALQVMRQDVTLLSSLPNTWPPAVLDMRAGDLVIAFDIRRYEPSILQLVELARDQNAYVVLITDRWVSPAASFAQYILPCHVEAPSAWDSLVPLVAIVEALLAAMQQRSWDETSDRLERLEALYDRTRLFKRLR